MYTPKSAEVAVLVIPGKRDALNHVDNQIRDAITYVEDLLRSLSPGVTASVWYEAHGQRYFLEYDRQKDGWRLLHSREADDETRRVRLSDAPRRVRAVVFATLDGAPSAMERLVIAIADALDVAHGERSPLLDVARRFVTMLEAAKAPESDGS